MNETLSEFRPIPEDEELEEVAQPNLMGFEMLQAENEVGVWGEEGRSPQRELHKEQPQSQTEDLNITQINVHQATGQTVNDEQRTEIKNDHHRSQPTETASEGTQGQNGQVSHNPTGGSTRDIAESNVGNIVKQGFR